MSASTKKEVKFIYCHNCGTKNGSDSKFCKKCGEELHITTSKQETEQSKEKKITEKLDKKEKEKPNKIHIGVYVLIIVIVAIIGSLGYIYLHSSTNSLGSSNSTYKGTNQSKPECTTSSQCPSGDYCTNFGECVTDYCGDGVCTAQKQQSNSCPIDCGCPSGEVLNRYSDKCGAPINVSITIIDNYIAGYLKNNSLTGNIISINNTYYQNQIVKEAVVNCQLNASYPCQVVFYFNESGSEIQTIRSD